MSKNIELQVNDVTLLPAKVLHFGKLKCLYENGNLRYISSGDEKVVRIIYTAVRDGNWDTAPYEITGESIEVFETGFNISYTAFYNLGQIKYKADVRIEAKENTVTFAMKGKALSRFQTNRVGICVLHPLPPCTGKKVSITQPDGDVYENTFPIEVSPHQPFKNMQEMKWTVANGIEAQLSFAGDVFETEDQRNWSDGSYKTYSRPLELPFPYWVEEGETMEQEVTLTIEAAETSSSELEKKSKIVDEAKFPFPLLGYCRNTNARPLSATEISLLLQIPFHHYRVALNLHDAEWQDTFNIAVLEVKQLKTKFELVVTFGNSIEVELKLLLDILKKDQELIYSILVLHKKHSVTPNGLLNYVYEEIKNTLPNVVVGYGTNSNFADLNRNRPTEARHDFVSFSLNPQVHATDSRTLIDNLDSHNSLIETAKTFTPGKAVHVSPVTLRSSTEEQSFNDADPRQHTMFTAWWMLQAIKNLSGAACLTFFETTGPKGIIKRAVDYVSGETLIEDDFTTPLYKVLQTIKAFNPKWIIVNRTAEQLRNNTLLLENEFEERIEFIAGDMNR